MAKLTITVDERVVKRAKKYAKQYGVSVSSLVANYLDTITRPHPEVEPTPILKELRGILRGAKEEDYHKYLEEKYLK